MRTEVKDHIDQRIRDNRISIYKIASEMGISHGVQWCKNDLGLNQKHSKLYQFSFRLESSIYWDITPCSQLKVRRRFGGTYRLHLQD
jgi:hypothetical protein